MIGLPAIVATLAAAPLPQELDDTALVEAAQQGDRRTFAQLYRRHLGAVFARLTRLVGPVPEREDLAQQVFLELYRALRSFRGESALGTFIHRIAVRVACRHLKRARRGPILLVDSAQPEEMQARGESPEATARVRQELAQALELLGRLTPRKRVAFILHVVEELPLPEVAALVGAEEGTVKQRVLAARRELLKMIARAEGPMRPEAP